ncbi:putative non-LTR retroelement reverse transcriptase [Trifolium medium]|uniref:Putative non-LTR retroelement reverse transcriptase n=1 Tax=Trifolium medium TaxID=97028 RepID=A0A392QQ01_9FABA|nr:putative non-LTR retroelement reverse transcriptase [Trifolium medium]
MVLDVHWMPPNSGWVIINTDGAVKDGNVAGCGGLIRGEDGSWICGFTKGLGVCTPYVVELWGASEGLRLAWNRGYRRVELHIVKVWIGLC